MSWYYRVIEFTEPDGSKVRAIHEVFYTDYKEGGRILTHYSENPAIVLDDSDDPTVMFKILARMSQALLLAVIPADTLEPETELPPELEEPDGSVSSDQLINDEPDTLDEGEGEK